MYSNQIIQSIELHRDGLRSPWGFRLKGGIDVDGGIPLEIIKVRKIYNCPDQLYIVTICTNSENLIIKVRQFVIVPISCIL